MGNFSILTNSGAYVALANLGGINSALSAVQNQVSTGLQMSSATDNAAVFAVAQGIRATLQQYNAVATGLNDAQSLVQSALAGATSISNLLPQITATLTQLADGSISDQQRVTYTQLVQSQVGEIQVMLNSATYNGNNLLGTSQGASANNVSVLSGINGQNFVVQGTNLAGNARGDNGYNALAFLVYGGGFSFVFGTHPIFTVIVNFDLSALGSADAAQALLLAPASSAAFSNNNVGARYGILPEFVSEINSALGSLGASANNIQLQLTFNQSIADSLTTGLGNLVDVNLAQASAKLTALQTQQQLATQSLSIANSQPNTILSLFK